MNMNLARGLRLSLAPTDRGVSKRGGGRKLRTPTSPAAGLHRLAIQAQAIVKDVALLDAPVFDELEDMAAESVDDALLERVEEAQDAGEAAAEGLQGAMERLKAGRERLEQVLQSQDQHKEDMQPA